MTSKDEDKFDFFSGCNRGGSGDVTSKDHYIYITDWTLNTMSRGVP